MKIIGHESMKRQLDVAISSSIKRNMSLPHMLFSGAAGCGKTSMAKFIAGKMDVSFMSVNPSDLKDETVVMRLMNSLNDSNYDAKGNRIGPIKPAIIFLDEIHNLPLKGQEQLGIAMEDYTLPGTKNKRIWLPYFTVIGATTLAGKLSKPFRDRFKITHIFQPYELEDMVKIVHYHAARLKVRLTRDGAVEIAKRSRGTPRIAVGYAERIRDKMVAIGSEFAVSSLIKSVFNDLGIDDEGFSQLEIRILKILFDANMPVGLDNLSIILQEDSKSIRDFAEPYLIRKGMILVSGKGRIITEKGIRYITESGKVDRLVKKEIDFNYTRS